MILTASAVSIILEGDDEEGAEAEEDEEEDEGAESGDESCETPN